MNESDSRYEDWRLALNRAIAVAGITVTFTFPLGFYARSAAPDQSSVPLLSQDGRGYYLMCLLVVGIIVALIEALDIDDPARLENRYGERIFGFRVPAPRTAWMLPAVGTFTVLLYLGQHHRLAMVMLAPFAAGAIVLVSRMARFHVLRNVRATATLATFALHLLTYVTAYCMLTALFAFRARTLITGPLMFLISFLLIMSLLDGLSTSGPRRMLYAAIGGLALAEVTWALSYWNVSAWLAGGILAGVFYFFASVARVVHAGTLTSRRVLERLAVAAPIFVILAYLAE